MNEEFRSRLLKVFNYASMAEIARQLKTPHATVRNYFQGRLPATEVLIKIASETGVSLNWLLLGQGEMYAGQLPPIGIGRFLEERIAEIIDKKIAGLGRDSVVELGTVDLREGFDVEAALLLHDDPQKVMSDWLRYEGRAFPADYGVVFFRGWETFSHQEKMDALNDAKRVLDRSLRG
jgi:transcriptional regulator with XRE-family HTH domain